MDIGTAKPSLEERRGVTHHLIDALEPWQSGSVAWWLERATECVRDIESRGRRALFVGGTPLYLKALLYGIFDSPPADAELRAQLEREEPAELHRRLTEVDAATAARLHPNDVRRVVRALEVWHLTGKPISSFQHQWSEPPAALAGRCWRIDRPREELYQRINARVVAMVEAGWLDEVRRLRESPHPPSKEAFQSIGYRELGDVLDGRLAVGEAIEQIQMRTRRYAKHQLTWFRSMGVPPAE